MDVGEWLKGIGLGQYEATFRAHDIDVDVLPDVTEADLEKIGLPLGARKRLMKAIANLRPAESELPRELPGKAPRPPAAPSRPPRTFRPDAERRPITVMFCDLVGSTALASRLDAEDWRSLVNAYLDEASAAVTRLGGHVLKRLGDGLMALFGYPQAQENDAERAVRAALTIQRALGEMNTRNAPKGAPQISARIGLESGPVVVEATGEVFGEAPNVAARVQGLAEPGTVLVTANVQRQTAGLFVAEDLGAYELKGVPAPVTLYRIVRASGGRRTGARALTPLVGREEELGHLRRRWERARSGAGQLTLIVGEPGIGKSRLVEEFRATLGETPHTFVELSSSQLLQNTPLHPIAEWGRARFGADEPADRRLADLENTLRLIGLDPAEYALLLAPLVDIPLPEERAAKLAPEELRRRQLAALTTWFLAGARSQPVALAFEDLHWADPTSLDLMQTLAERGAQAPLLILATARPEFRPPWSLRSHHSVISLSPLDRADVALMVGELAARHALSREVVEGVSERTGGVPLFVEEVTRLLLERGEAGGLQAIPPTLQQSLAARLDRLGEAREVAQIGAVLGRDFTYALLRAVGGIDDPALQSALDKLAGADLLIAEGAGHESSYRFKHALIQDAAYDSLLKSRRQALHRRAAEILAGQPERAAAEPEVIAHHFTEAGLADQAIEWWGKAGDQALRRSAFQEAIVHLGKAIAMADKGGETGSTHDRLKLQTIFGQAMGWSRGLAAEETKAATAHATQLAAVVNDPAARLTVYYGQWITNLMGGQIGRARTIAHTYLGEARNAGVLQDVALASRLVGQVGLYQGAFADARAHLETALASYDPTCNIQLTLGQGADTETAATVNLAIVFWQLGEVERARELTELAKTHAVESGRPLTLAYTHTFTALFEAFRGDAGEAVRDAKAIAQAAGNEFPRNFPIAKILQGWARARLNDRDGGLEELRQGLTAYAEHKILFTLPVAQGFLSELEAEGPSADAALARIDEALRLARQTGERWTDAFLHRIRGDILLKADPGNPARAEDAYLNAIAIAREQGAPSFGLQAALKLAKLYQSTSRPVEAHAVLAPALVGFSPTPEMPEIAEAEALLAALAQTDEVKADAAKRQRRLQLQTAYGNALIAVRGFGSPETTEAFSKARESAVGEEGASERLAADYGLWASSYARGALSSMRVYAKAFLSDVEAAPDSPEAGIAHRIAGATHLCAGEYREAREHLERALALFQPGRDDDLAFRFGQDAGVAAMSFLALALWALGGVERARSLIESAQARSASVTHIGTHVYEKALAAWFELVCGDLRRAARNGVELARLAREHDLPFWRPGGVFYEGLAKAESGALGGGLEDMRRGVELLRDQNILVFDALFRLALAEAEAGAGDVDRALTILDHALATCESIGYREAELHRARGEMLLKRDPANPAPAEEALGTAIAVAKRQGARSFELRASLSLAKLYQSTNRSADAHTVLTPALEGFSPTPEMPEIAEAQTLLAALAGTDKVRAQVAQRHRLTQLQVSYGNALYAARGPGAPETAQAFASARDSAVGAKDAPERLAADYGLWVGSYVRGELTEMRAHAAAFLSDVAAEPNSPEAGVAHRVAGVTHWFAGEYREAREHLEQALGLFQPGRDDDLAFRFGFDAGASAMAYLAFASWSLGAVRPARSLIESIQVRMASVTQAGARAAGKMLAAMFELMRGDLSRATPHGVELARLSREHDLPFWRAFGVFLEGLVLAESGARGDGLEEMRRGAALLREEHVLFFESLLKIALAEAEARAGDVDRALTILGEALVTTDRTGFRAFEAELHRARGDILLKRDPASAAPAEEALLTAIAVAKQQGTCSFELRAALSMAKLYQSTSRHADAHAVLAPALEGFRPTPEMPEIAEAQALLAALAETEEVKAAIAQLRRRLDLQTSYGQALQFGKGFAAEETEAAFARLAEFARPNENPAARFGAFYGQWISNYFRGEFSVAREMAETFLREAEADGRATEAGTARRLLGLVLFFQGDLKAARSFLERALADFVPERDGDARRLDGQATGTAILASVVWHLGEVERARLLIQQAIRRARELGHPATIAGALLWNAYLEIRRDDVAATRLAADVSTKLGEEHGINFYAAAGQVCAYWASGRLVDPEAGASGLRQALHAYMAQGNKNDAPLFHGMLAELEAATRGPDSALTLIDQGLTIAEETGGRFMDPYLHRLRGDILLKRDPADPAHAEDAYRTAIAIARQQGARSYELLASLSLAKLYQSTGRPAEAHAALAPALEGFSPTPEMREIAEATVLIERLA